MCSGEILRASLGLKKVVDGDWGQTRPFCVMGDVVMGDVVDSVMGDVVDSVE